jgi:hypothetical protein
LFCSLKNFINPFILVSTILAILLPSERGTDGDFKHHEID